MPRRVTLPRRDAPSGPPGRLVVSEIFASLQGEGPSTGRACVFLRLAGCNLACAWCDTEYSWDFRRFDAARETRAMTVEVVAARLAEVSRSLLVVTGGEPLLQAPALATLFAALPPEMEIEVETNGTRAPGAALLARVTRWNLSPKLASSGEPLAERLREDVLGALAGDERAWLKLVVSDEADLAEAEALVARLGWRGDRVLLMPQARDRLALAERLPWVGDAALSRGYGVSTRLHVALWNGERGR
jgi:7-carboxy-7-deazaguanine synthase